MTKARICPICGKEFIPRPNQKYCSPTCKSTHYYRELEARKADRGRIERLEKEADWLACQLEIREHACEFCYGGNCTGRYGGIKCGYQGPDNWREAARKAVEVQNDNS